MENVLTLEEAWQRLYDEYIPEHNIYDLYVLKEDWETALDNMSIASDIYLQLEELERIHGLQSLQDEIAYWQDMLTKLTLPTFGYKYSIPEDVEREIRIKKREISQTLKELETELSLQYNSIMVDPEIFNTKFYTGEINYGD